MPTDDITAAGNEELLRKAAAAAPLMGRLMDIDLMLQDSKGMYFLSGTMMQPNIPGRMLLYLLIGLILGYFVGFFGLVLTDSMKVLLILMICVTIATGILGFVTAIGDKKRADYMHTEMQNRIESMQKEREEILHSDALAWLPEDYRKPSAFYRLAIILCERRAGTLSQALSIYLYEHRHSDDDPEAVADARIAAEKLLRSQ